MKCLGLKWIDGNRCPGCSDCLKPCDNPECERSVRKGIQFCCSACSGLAPDRRRLPGEHSEGCDQRHEERRSAFGICVACSCPLRSDGRCPMCESKMAAGL